MPITGHNLFVAVSDNIRQARNFKVDPEIFRMSQKRKLLVLWAFYALCRELWYFGSVSATLARAKRFFMFENRARYYFSALHCDWLCVQPKMLEGTHREYVKDPKTKEVRELIWTKAYESRNHLGQIQCSYADTFWTRLRHYNLEQTKILCDLGMPWFPEQMPNTLIGIHKKNT